MAVPSVPCHQISEGISFRSAVDRSHILQPLIEEEDTLIVFLGEPRDLTLLCSSTVGQSWGTLILEWITGGLALLTVLS